MTRNIVLVGNYIEDTVLAWLQRRCDHPGMMVAADLLEGCADGIQVRYCRRCGAVKTDWTPQPQVGRSSRYAVLEHTWRRPDPHLWRDPIVWFRRHFSKVHAIILTLAASLALAACTPQQLSDAQRYQADIASVCGVAMTLAPIAGPVAPWIIGGCGTESAIAKLALDPTSLVWLNGMLAKVRQA